MNCVGLLSGRLRIMKSHGAELFTQAGSFIRLIAPLTVGHELVVFDADAVWTAAIALFVDLT
jgi:hypothetical protein